MSYDAAKDSRDSYDAAIAAKLQAAVGAIRKEVVIGNCRLLLGDSLAIMPSIGAVHHVITDPPYEDELHKAIGRIRRNDGREMVQDIGFDGINASRTAVAAAIVEISMGWALVFTLAEGVRAWRDDIQVAGGKWDTCLAWIKPDASPRFNGQGAARGFENCVTAWCGRGYRSWNSGGKRGVYTHCVNVGRHGEHPTEKPVPLMAELVADFTQAGQIILDPFMGSGTTGVACIRTGRSFIGIEQDERYFEIAVERISKAAAQPDMFLAGREPKAVQHDIFSNSSQPVTDLPATKAEVSPSRPASATNSEAAAA